MESFFDYCKNYILDNLENYEGNNVYMCDLSIELTEGMCADGTFTYSTAKAEQYLIEWIGEAGEFFDYEKANFGQNTNPFSNVELFLVRMVSEGVRAILSQCPTVTSDENWNSEMELTAELIQKIKDEVEEVEEGEDLF